MYLVVKDLSSDFFSLSCSLELPLVVVHCYIYVEYEGIKAVNLAVLLGSVVN
jgi:hypothetical protein